MSAHSICEVPGMDPRYVRVVCGDCGCVGEIRDVDAGEILLVIDECNGHVCDGAR